MPAARGGRGAEQMRSICAFDRPRPRPRAPTSGRGIRIIIPSHRRPRAYPSPFPPRPPLPVPSVIKTGVISQAAGSAYVEFDKTKVMCGVYGPRQGGKMGGATNDRGRVEVDVKLATFATPGARGKTGQGDAEREFSSLVLRALEGAIIAETFPKTSDCGRLRHRHRGGRGGALRNGGGGVCGARASRRRHARPCLGVFGEQSHRGGCGSGKR